jgi:hypothetical protein
MKTLKLFTKMLLLLVITGSMFGSCSKEAGPKGDTGAQGQQGEKGIAGPDGSTILNGTVVPTASVGANGDFYINTVTSIIYGPKTAAGWGAGKSILGAAGATGAAGAAGAAGSKILSGAGTPAATTGAIGDYYLDKNSYSLYGPKTSTGWGVALSLKGTANVIYSGWNVAVNARDTTADGTLLKAVDLLAPALTADFLNNSMVQVYFNFGGGVYALPYSSYAGGKLNTISYFPRVKHFIITRFTADNSNSTPLPLSLQYRYVIIPGGTAVSVAKKIDMNNYEAVKKAYNIPD